MTVSISPVWNGSQFFDNNGVVLNGGEIWQYEAGSTSIQQTTYSDNLGSTPNSNPIVLDSAGRIPVEMYLTDGLAYNLVLTDSSGTTVYGFVDYVVGVQAATTASPSSAVWNGISSAPTFVNTNTFTLAGNFITDFAIGNRVQIDYGSSVYTYGTVSSVSYSAGTTQVNIINDSTPLNSGMLNANWSIATVAGPIVDAGGVTYEVPSSYTTTYTVGYQIKTINTTLATLQSEIIQTYKVIQVSGAPTYAGTTDSNITSYSIGQVFPIQFGGASAGATLNLNGIGAKPIYQYTSSGGATSATIVNGQVTLVIYDGANFLLTTPLPPAPYVAPTVPHGSQVFTSNGSFTVPSDVYSIKVTVVGGAGGGGDGYYYLDPSSGITVYVNGGNGGANIQAIKHLSVTPATVYTVSIGAGGGTNTGAAGSPGGSSTFGASLCVANGSGGGLYAVLTNGATGNPSVYDYGNNSYLYVAGAIRPKSGTGFTQAGGPYAGTSGCCVVEW